MQFARMLVQMKRPFAIGGAVVLCIYGLSQSQAEEPQSLKHQDHDANSSKGAQFTVTINPEARVSVRITGPIPSVLCGEAVSVAVRIVNQGFVTSALEARTVDAPNGVTVELDPARLSGAPEEWRTLRVTLERPGPTDVTVAIGAHNQMPDLGGRDRVHFLLSCVLG